MLKQEEMIIQVGLDIYIKLFIKDKNICGANIDKYLLENQEYQL